MLQNYQKILETSFVKLQAYFIDIYFVCNTNNNLELVYNAIIRDYLITFRMDKYANIFINNLYKVMKMVVP